ncbi:hypothetical protein MVEN_00149800 [Mycena venus]|uniref:F-box domain-containing protein n=1 Tax=Mycena venus TaxID=2733690 RepID=A0A8H6YXI5_9AGAR|nr:hypothetical protein MVEN_00149800 [Mycena venus]
MHKCWNVPELTRLILEELGKPIPGNLAHITLHRLKTICRVLSYPALDLLWEEQYALVPLLKCLPSHLWDVSDRIFKIRSPIASADWERVFVYSSRVKKFSDNPILDVPLDASVLEAIVMSQPMVSLFPNIREVCSDCNSNLFPLLRFLLGPKLETAIFCLDGPVWRLGVLPGLASKCTSLRNLSLSVRQGSHDRDDATAYISAFVAQLAHVRRVNVTSLNAVAYLHLSHLLSLETLNVANLDSIPFPVGQGISDGPFFPALHRLTLSMRNLPFAANFMSVPVNAPLCAVFIDAQDPATEAELSAFLRTFQAHCSFNRLTSVRLHVGEQSDRGRVIRTTHIMTSATLRPLLSFPNLRFLDIFSPQGFSFDDDFLAAMALAWPQIEQLIIGGRPPKKNPKPRVTALAVLSRNCPRLQHLSLTVDATQLQEDHSPRRERVVQTALHSANFNDSAIESASEVAALLSSIFPSLKRVKSSSESYKEEWVEVRKLIPMFAKIRADEKQFWVQE